MAERPAVNRKAAGSILVVPSLSMELRPMAGQLSDAQPMWVRFPQLRFDRGVWPPVHVTSGSCDLNHGG